MSPRVFDVAVAGGGPAGAAAAIILARRGRRVLLAHDALPDERSIGESLPPSGHTLLHQLGLQSQLCRDAHNVSYGNVSAWGSPELQTTDFIHCPQGHGLQLDRPRFDAGLRQAALEAGTCIEAGARLRAVLASRGSDEMHHEIALCRDGKVIAVTCRWLVDAGGRSSTLARRLGAPRIRTDRLVAFHMRLRSTEASDADSRTWVESTEHGWWYSALLPGGQRLACFLTDADLVGDRRRRLSTDGHWSALLETRHLSRLCRQHAYLPAGQPRTADASSARLGFPSGPRWIAAGDSALSLDPLSSQGIANALYTGIRAGLAIDAALDGNGEPMAQYGPHLEAIYAAYLAHRRTTYALEQRWCQSPFWRRRHESRLAMHGELSA